jgi:3-deoxy-D-manno-octulosonate 8-phosphate phosphatase (KDO 8-P phosphatase)
MRSPTKQKASLHRLTQRVKCVLLDVDGVMTDGGLYYSAEGQELKRFNAQDGYGIVRAREAGLIVGIVSGRSTPIIDARAKVLKIDDVYQGADDKVGAMREIQVKYGLADAAFAYIADDLFDLPLLEAVGFSGAPRNARPEVRRRVHYVTKASGGEGAVREFIDFILDHRNTHGRSRTGN